MKRIVQTLLLATFLIFISCGGSLSSDAQKVADLQCKTKELQQKAMSGDTASQEDLQEYMAEAADLVQQMNAKYNSFEEKKKFSEALLNAKANCN
jgi:hypothetical protein